MPEEPLQVDRREGVVRLTLNRPARLNCVDRDLNRRLRVALDELAVDRELRAVVITGAGRAFCTGQDLAERHADLQAGAPDLGSALEEGFNRIVGGIRALEVPVVAAVNGVAAGAGAGLALACDLVLAARSASFVLSFVEVGLVPDTGLSWTLPRRVGAARARGMAFTGEAVDAVTAAEWGLVWRCVDDAALEEEADALVADLVRRPRHALAGIKQALNAAESQSLDAQLALEASLQRAAGKAPDYRAAVENFVARGRKKRA
ncbi:MAG: enoyl-CoA hydratase-related protein [Gammaproteobacteria bacterium]|nr:enoyl-CoA hydratase-related protein [Gammaproteobacteria bacterium]